MNSDQPFTPIKNQTDPLRQEDETFAVIEPFGWRITREGAAVTGAVRDLRLGLTGHDHGDELGPINLGGRIYDPQLKRVSTSDPYVTAPLFGKYGTIQRDGRNRRGSSCSTST